MQIADLIQMIMGGAFSVLTGAALFIFNGFRKSNEKLGEKLDKHITNREIHPNGSMLQTMSGQITTLGERIDKVYEKL